MPAAFAAALSAAAGHAFYDLPLTPEAVWRAARGDSREGAPVDARMLSGAGARA
jgi:hypothetical protein